ncbi:MAG: LysR family transcriptional regulator [Bacteroidales bacterium]|nr:LysR family transcriptional regulator [Bacteroidales bacterium]
MITLIQLEYVVAVDTYRHFATAAEKCFVTQPTLSMQLKKLEEEIGVVLFDRNRQPVIPTAAGLRIIEQARLVLQEAKKIKLLADEERLQISGELRIGVIPTIAPYLLPLFAGQYKRKHPGVQLKVEELITEQIEEKLQKDMLDVGIVVTPLHNKSIMEQPLFYEEMMIYSNLQHPLVHQPIIQINDIASPEMWLLSDGHCFRHQVVNLCDLHELKSEELPFEFESGSLDTLIKIIDQEGGYTLIPELMSYELEATKKEQIRQFNNIHPLREVSLVFTRQFAKTKLVSVLAEHIQNSLPQHMQNKDRGTVVEWR